MKRLRKCILSILVLALTHPLLTFAITQEAYQEKAYQNEINYFSKFTKLPNPR
jgi:multisubunit Na+/H+ antiporter MnhG subunit